LIELFAGLADYIQYKLRKTNSIIASFLGHGKV